jgi:Calcineurin-like phosphoesterase
MPSIAAGAQKNSAVFYWHLGDLRATYQPDEDYKAEPEHRGQTVDQNSYLRDEWTDFIKNQITPFDPLPFFIGIGNHETVKPKTRAEFASQFSPWLSSPTLQQQRAADRSWDKGPQVRTYYHWIQGGIDFIYLDNATQDEFNPQQVNWVENVLRHAEKNPAVRGVVVGMHEALPDSLAANHSMNDWPLGITTGRRVYEDILKFKRKTDKPVYVLASHSHFYMSDIFESDYWRFHGGVLPGWIVGTAGAFRYVLPPDASRAKEARQKVYGYLLGTVHPDGKIDFAFQEVQRGDILDAINQRYTPAFVDYCFNQNADPAIPAQGAQK